MKWKFTNIQHGPRKALSLSMLEYAYLDLVYQSQTHPSYTKDGWADTSHRQLSDFLGISVGTSFGIAERMATRGFLEINPGDPQLKRATAQWYDNAYLEDDTLIVVQNLNVQKLNTKRSETERKRSETEQLNKEIKEKVNNIVEFLNETVGGKYRATTKQTVSNINARLSEGYTVDDFKLVIENQTRKWRGTDQEQYLTPSTLFRPANFEKYLNNARREQQQQVNTDAALNNVTLSDKYETAYQKYIAHVIDNYPKLWNSRTRILNKKEFFGWYAYKILPGCATKFSPTEYRQIILQAHGEANASAHIRDKFTAISEFIETKMRQPA